MSLLLGCGSSPKVKPADVGLVANSLNLQPVWSFAGGAIDIPLAINVQAKALGLANGRGAVWALDPSTGRELWRTQVGALSAGVGSDGQFYAVMGQQSELIVIRDGKEIWRKAMTAQSFTPPLVAGGRVFVLSADRSVWAFDAANGRVLWSQARPGEPLVLRQMGVLLPIGDVLVAGQGGRLVGIQPLSGAVLWEASIGTSRGTNDMERLVDLVGPASRASSVVCARAFQAQIGCVDSRNAALLWSRRSVGDQGLSGDDRMLLASDGNGLLTAWSRSNGEKLWESDRLRYRQLTAPLFTPAASVVGDSGGQLYFFSNQDGGLIHRVGSDGSGWAANPTAVQERIITVTRKGLVQAWQITPARP
jgi:outer membrane protein assembly factor BamB